MNGDRTKPSRTKRLTRRRCAKKNESTMREACLNMGMPNLVAKNDLYYVGQLGMTGSLLEQEKTEQVCMKVIGIAWCSSLSGQLQRCFMGMTMR